MKKSINVGNLFSPNTIIIGKSWSGKSYATKTLLANLASDNEKIFILAPENEYGNLAKNLNGRVLDVSSSKNGRINLFQIITSLDDENNDDYTHVVFHIWIIFYAQSLMFFSFLYVLVYLINLNW